MKKVFALAGLAIFTLGIGAFADTAVVVLKTGNNLMGASLVPYDPSPSSVFKNDVSAPITITGNRLSRWDPLATPAPTYKYYSTLGGGAAFGKVLLGSGFFLKNDTGADIYWLYQGVPNGVPDGSSKKTDMWISLPKAGFNMVSNPFAEDIVWSNCLMTDGNTTVSTTVAKTNLWWEGNLQYWDPAATPAPTFKNVVLTGLGQRNLKPYTGYFLKTKVNNLALIVPANP